MRFKPKYIDNNSKNTARYIYIICVQTFKYLIDQTGF